MATPVFLTVDIEIMWRHHAAGLDPATLYERSFEPAGVGVSYQLEMLRQHDLKASFFVDPMPALLYGLDPFRRVIDTIQSAGQRVQLHLHPNWTGASRDDRTGTNGRFHLSDYDRAEQVALIEGARDLLVAAGALPPIAFRAGSYAGNDDTLSALATLGFEYDSSHNGSVHPNPSAIDLPARQIAPIARRGLIEVPVTLIEERQGALRNFQICALSAEEMRAALDHAVEQDHAVVTIVNHGFELANRTGTSANAVHVRRFDTLCALLDERRDALPTQHFADRPVLRLGQDDAPLRPSMARRRWRQAEQLWSNMISERAL
ncbi:polysaccharide deacetylase [Sphingomonas sp. 28-63-12]|uniref:polysaccharide deacetylase n=1 Tax=Sphingomonas sp. 28-63-12 TaxID=1970434 RepID=UPI000BD5FDDC|nr:MAG: polysaccharide deacetylase [Sphingomonas sp. 28-63-12]